MSANVPFRERISCTIAEACTATGLSRSKLYEEIGANRVRVSRSCGRTLILIDSLVHLILGHVPQAPKSTTEAQGRATVTYAGLALEKSNHQRRPLP
jgi:hypothetical protein